jgi:hypothetical protein
MSQLALVLEMLAVLVVGPAGLWALGARARRRGLRLSAMAPVEEIYNPVAYTTNIQINVQAERRAPAPAPGDPPRLT